MKKGSSDLLLLDINVLLALAWPNHQFHQSAIQRFADRRIRWATCVVTQLGFIRLSSNPAAVSPARSPVESRVLLSEMVADPNHVFLPRSPEPAKIDEFAKILGTQQVTDLYLLFLARQHQASLVTFDRRLRSIGGNADDVEVLG
jgi:toxin-antitoxin system PIN domain toxin